MQIFVLFNNHERTEATVEFRPCWLARVLLRRRPVFGVIERETKPAYNGTIDWRWQNTGRECDQRVRDAIEKRPLDLIEHEKRIPRAIVIPTDQASS